MKLNYKNAIIGATALFMPLKSANTPVSTIQKQVINHEPLTYTLNNRAAALDSLMNRQADMIREINTRHLLNFPKVPQPSRNLDISKTRYFGHQEFLNLFLEGGVMEGKGDKFIQAQEKHGINATFLIGVANHESYYGKSDYARTRNNIAGMRGKDGYMRFDSVDECIDKMAQNLKEKYVDKGLTTISQINKKYAESDEWSRQVIDHMNPMYNASKCLVFDFSKK